jgi:hypothetical protein
MRGFLRPWLSRRGQYATAAALIGLLVILFFLPVFTSQKTFSTVHELQQRAYPWYDPQHPTKNPYYVQTDQAAVYYPWEVLTRNSLREHGDLPLWDPQSFAGHPLYANSQTGLAYPPRLILAELVSPSWVHDLYLMFHIWLGGLAMFALLKEFGARFAGALLSGVAWSFSSFTAFWIQLENYAVVLALLPFVVLCIHRWHARRSWRALAVGGLLLGVIFVGGSPEIALPCFVLAFVYAASFSLTRLVSGWRQLATRQRLVIAAAPVGLGVVAVAVAAVALLPFLALQSRYAREPFTLSENLKLGKVVPGDLLHTFVPADLPLTSTNTAVFVGSIAGLVAVIGFFRRRPGAGLARGTAILLLLFFSVPPFQWLVYNAIPKLNFVGGLGRLLFVWVFAVAILAGLGLDAVVTIVRRRSERWVATPDAPGAPDAPDPRRDDRLPWERWSSRSWRRLAPAARRAAPALVGVVCVGLTAAQLFVYMRDANPPFQARSASQLFPDTPAITAVRQAIGPAPGRDRFLPLTGPTGGPPASVPLVWATSLALDLPSAGGYESALPTDTADLWRFVAGESLDTIRRNQIRFAFGPYFAQGTRMELLGRLGIAAVLTEPNVSFSPEQLEAWHLRETYRGRDGVVFEVLDRPRRAFLADRAVRVDDADQALERLVGPDFDPRREVILDDAKSARDNPATTPAEGNAGGRVRWLEDSADELRLEVRSEKPSWLVVLDSWDPGWSASIDGHPTDMVRADYNFRAVHVPAGTSTIRMSYEPPGLVLGAVISGVTVTLIVVALVAPLLWGYARRRSALRNAGEHDGAGRRAHDDEPENTEGLVLADHPPAAD